MSRPEVATLVAAMVRAREAVGWRSWSHPQEPTAEAWWADVLADPRARKRELAVSPAFYRLTDDNARRSWSLAASANGRHRLAGLC